MNPSAIISAFLAAAGKWTGCQWPTRFGNRELNLEGIKSSQAALMARSTAGAEKAEWKAATRWLESVERDAREAEQAAGLAADLAEEGMYAKALEQAERACKLEANYPNGNVWRPLREAIAEVLAQSVAAGTVLNSQSNGAELSPRHIQNQE